MEIEIGLALKLEIVAALNWKSLHPLKSVLPVEIDLHPLKSVLHPLKSVLNWKSVLPVVIDLPEIGGVASNFSSREFASISNRYELCFLEIDLPEKETLACCNRFA